ncbi:MAG: hypothetical protein QG670_547 [Thermoproteota archaeon]|nr:hypothetical protein [Thermoproteota archaeon]
MECLILVRMSTEPIPSDVLQRVEDLRKVGFNVSFEVLVLDTKKIGLVFKITKEKPKT